MRLAWAAIAVGAGVLVVEVGRDEPEPGERGRTSGGGGVDRPGEALDEQLDLGLVDDQWWADMTASCTGPLPAG